MGLSPDKCAAAQHLQSVTGSDGDRRPSPTSSPFDALPTASSAALVTAGSGRLSSGVVSGSARVSAGLAAAAVKAARAAVAAEGSGGGVLRRVGSGPLQAGASALPAQGLPASRSLRVPSDARVPSPRSSASAVSNTAELRAMIAAAAAGSPAAAGFDPFSSVRSGGRVSSPGRSSSGRAAAATAAALAAAVAAQHELGPGLEPGPQRAPGSGSRLTRARSQGGVAVSRMAGTAPSSPAAAYRGSHSGLGTLAEASPSPLGRLARHRASMGRALPLDPAAAVRTSRLVTDSSVGATAGSAGASDLALLSGRRAPSSAGRRSAPDTEASARSARTSPYSHGSHDSEGRAAPDTPFAAASQQATLAELQARLAEQAAAIARLEAAAAAGRAGPPATRLRQSRSLAALGEEEGTLGLPAGLSAHSAVATASVAEGLRASQAGGFELSGGRASAPARRPLPLLLSTGEETWGMGGTSEGEGASAGASALSTPAGDSLTQGAAAGSERVQSRRHELTAPHRSPSVSGKGSPPHLMQPAVSGASDGGIFTARTDSVAGASGRVTAPAYAAAATSGSTGPSPALETMLSERDPRPRAGAGAALLTLSRSLRTPLPAALSPSAADAATRSGAGGGAGLLSGRGGATSAWAVHMGLEHQAMMAAVRAELGPEGDAGGAAGAVGGTSQEGVVEAGVEGDERASSGQASGGERRSTQVLAASDVEAAVAAAAAARVREARAALQRQLAAAQAAAAAVEAAGLAPGSFFRNSHAGSSRGGPGAEGYDSDFAGSGLASPHTHSPHTGSPSMASRARSVRAPAGSGRGPGTPLRMSISGLGLALGIAAAADGSPGFAGDWADALPAAAGASPRPSHSGVGTPSGAHSPHLDSHCSSPVGPRSIGGTGGAAAALWRAASAAINGLSDSGASTPVHRTGSRLGTPRAGAVGSLSRLADESGGSGPGGGAGGSPLASTGGAKAAAPPLMSSIMLASRNAAVAAAAAQQATAGVGFSGGGPCA
ncbi:hypothetical protein HYH03_002377 [Edaphochlamys debaryana]|uniref:Uncharacterized protein n=1 Tax=Edaphochlamys debaryana TaxID=47281 RepID=A0A835YIW9_9CHLO|nr:hypothetical protein HYH03_002377 [Edaphochlamys debaryana]|eukprot:KAG2499430.1 hypothetical protein HYH03_002377 [Edaphochlamys debaryana]